MPDINIIELLVCPSCHSHVELSHKGEYIICKTCKKAYPVKDNIPIMLIDSALNIEDIKE